MTKLNIEDVDRDGAVREMADAVEGDTRADLLRRAALATGGMVAGGAALAALPGVAAAQSSRDKAILNFALVLEELEATFYALALKNLNPQGEVGAFTRTVAEHEDEHRRFLRKVLGSDAAPKPTFDFRDTVTDQATFLQTAILLEDTGVKAYKGQAPRIQSTSVLKAALAIHSVEARHAGWVRTLVVGATPIPESVEKPMTREQVLAAVTKTGFVTSGL